MDTDLEHNLIQPSRLVSKVSMATPIPVDVAGLQAALREAIDGEVRFSDGDRALWATDASNYRQLPIGVVIPRHKEDVVAAIEVCRQFNAPIVSRGGGTALAGQTCNFAVVLEMSKYFKGVLQLEPLEKWARVLPGTVLDTLRDAAVQHNLTFGPDPATHNHNTLGGMLGNNSCGPHSVMAGRTVENVLDMEIVTYRGLRLRVGPTSREELAQIIAAGGERGRIYERMARLARRYADLIRKRYPDIPRRVSGYNLDELLPENGFNVARALVGSESTLVTILEARLRLIDWPKARSLLVIGYRDVFEAGDHICEVMSHKPLAVEGLDHRLIENIKKKGAHSEYLSRLPEGHAYVVAEFGGETQEEANARAAEVGAIIRAHDLVVHTEVVPTPDEQEKIWKIRESGLGSTARVPGEPDTWPGWEDSACPPERLGDYLREMRKLYDKYDYHPALYGHFGQACVHCRVDFDLKSAEGIAKWRSFLNEAADLVVRFGGSISGEHGDGQARAELLNKMFGPELVEAFREFKDIWDPDWRMNPGKVVEPYKITENLRLGSDYDPPQVETHFKYPQDDGDFTRAVERCVGVGKCRREGSGTMCPSYMVTHEEMHSTRGRAHLLWEMMRGDELERWKDDHILEALDLCLACKGCKGDCPINVDMATYKAEYYSHYYKGKIRPIAAYSMGLVHWWARLGSKVPGLANFITQTPGLSALFKRLGGVAPERQIPQLASPTFREWFQRRTPRNPGGPPVLLWADTFNNYFFPSTAQAAIEVLEAAGYNVMIQPASLCCGRPLYDFGMLDTAKVLLERTLKQLKEPIEAGIPVVGLEPSCVAVFRDELVELYPNRSDAQRLKKQTYLFGEFLKEKAPHLQLPKLERQAIVHGHCHHKSLFGMEDEKHVLEERLGMDMRLLDSGCCGMAGSFGFERGDKYDVSVKCGERVLLPEVRQADGNAFIVADGFSCREQIEQMTDRRALHVAEVTRIAMLQGPNGPVGPYPERSWLPSEDSHPMLHPAKPAAAGALALAGAALLFRRSKVAAGVLGAVGVASGIMAALAAKQRR